MCLLRINTEQRSQARFQVELGESHGVYIPAPGGGDTTNNGQGMATVVCLDTLELLTVRWLLLQPKILHMHRPCFYGFNSKLFFKEFQMMTCFQKEGGLIVTKDDVLCARRWIFLPSRSGGSEANREHRFELLSCVPIKYWHTWPCVAKHSFNGENTGLLMFGDGNCSGHRRILGRKIQFGFSETWFLLT